MTDALLDTKSNPVAPRRARNLPRVGLLVGLTLALTGVASCGATQNSATPGARDNTGPHAQDSAIPGATYTPDDALPPGVNTDMELPYNVPKEVDANVNCEKAVSNSDNTEVLYWHSICMRWNTSAFKTFASPGNASVPKFQFTKFKYYYGTGNTYHTVLKKPVLTRDQHILAATGAELSNTANMEWEIEPLGGVAGPSDAQGEQLAVGEQDEINDLNVGGVSNQAFDGGWDGSAKCDDNVSTFVNCFIPEEFKKQKPVGTEHSYPVFEPTARLSTAPFSVKIHNDTGSKLESMQVQEAGGLRKSVKGTSDLGGSTTLAPNIKDGADAYYSGYRDASSGSVQSVGLTYAFDDDGAKRQILITFKMTPTEKEKPDPTTWRISTVGSSCVDVTPHKPTRVVDCEIADKGSNWHDAVELLVRVNAP